MRPDEWFHTPQRDFVRALLIQEQFNLGKTQAHDAHQARQAQLAEINE